MVRMERNKCKEQFDGDNSLKTFILKPIKLKVKVTLEKTIKTQMRSKGIALLFP
jgi:hypothetical protein